MTIDTLSEPGVGLLPDLPGLRVRAWRGLDDIPGMAAVASAANRAVGSADNTSVEDMAANYRNLVNCDPERDIWVVEMAGTTVAYARTWWEDHHDGVRVFQAISFVDPAVADRGIEDVLHAIGEWRQLGVAAGMAAELPGRDAVLARYARRSETAALDRLERAGYRLARRWAEMRRADLSDIPDIPVPKGLRLTRVDPGLVADEALLRRVWDVGTEVFADHYGEATPTEADWRKFLESPQTQPALWCLAVDAATGDIAGHILNYLGEPGPDGAIVGWTESIAVRAPYRRRGLASAMLAESLRIVRDAGATSAELGVDQQNPNHAMTLYERLGFRVVLEDLEFHKPIEVRP